MAVWGPDAPPREGLLSYAIAQPRALRWYDVFLLPLGAVVFTLAAATAAIVLDWNLGAPGDARLGDWARVTSSTVWFAYLAQVALYAGFILTGVVLLALRGYRLASAYFPRTRFRHALAAGGVGTVFAVAFMWALSMLPAETQQQLVEQGDLLAPSSAGEAIMLAIVAVLFAPIAEELYFRGVLFRLLSARLSFVWSAGISALLFSLVHGHLFMLPGLGGWVLTAMIFAVGFVLSGFARATGSLRAPAIMHGVYNAVMLGPNVLFAFMDVPA